MYENRSIEHEWFIQTLGHFVCLEVQTHRSIQTGLDQPEIIIFTVYIIKVLY